METITLLNDFSVFTSYLFLGLTNVFNWLANNILGELLFFIVLIAICMSIFEFIVKLKEIK